MLLNQAFDKAINEMNKRLEDLYNKDSQLWQEMDKIHQKLWNAEEGSEKFIRLNTALTKLTEEQTKLQDKM